MLCVYYFFCKYFWNFKIFMNLIFIHEKLLLFYKDYVELILKYIIVLTKSKKI